MAPLSNVIDLLADKFARLRRGRFTFRRIATGAFNGGFLWHEDSFLWCHRAERPEIVPPWGRFAAMPATFASGLRWSHDPTTNGRGQAPGDYGAVFAGAVKPRRSSSGSM